MPAVKICGLTRLADAELALQLGADYVGMVFHPLSRRLCLPEQAAPIVALAPAGRSVLVFGHDESELILSIYRRFASYRPLLQLPHSHQNFARLRSQLGLENVVPSVSVQGPLPADFLHSFSSCPFVILDAGGQTGADGRPVAGGTGQVFDWSWLQALPGRDFFLAGGLNPANICQALRQVAARGYDSAGGVEAGPGIKDPAKLANFIGRIKNPALCPELESL